jgi:hypothetical protein
MEAPGRAVHGDGENIGIGVQKIGKTSQLDQESKSPAKKHDGAFESLWNRLCNRIKQTLAKRQRITTSFPYALLPTTHVHAAFDRLGFSDQRELGALGGGGYCNLAEIAAEK